MTGMSTCATCCIVLKGAFNPKKQVWEATAGGEGRQENSVQQMELRLWQLGFDSVFLKEIYGHGLGFKIDVWLLV